MKDLVVSTCNIQTLVDLIADAVEERISKVKGDEIANKKYLTGREVEELLSISATTRHVWSKKGILTKHKIGGRVRYLQEEVRIALKDNQRRGKLKVLDV